MNDPTSFWQYSGSVGVFSSWHGSGGGDGLGGVGGMGQSVPQPSLHLITSGWLGL